MRRATIPRLSPIRSPPRSSHTLCLDREIQFFTEVVSAMENTFGGKGRSDYDPDELGEEDRERQMSVRPRPYPRARCYLLLTPRCPPPPLPAHAGNKR